jgi:hypothetical protein
MGNRKLCWPGGKANYGSTITLHNLKMLSVYRTTPSTSLTGGIFFASGYSMTMRGAARWLFPSEMAAQTRAAISR